MRLSLLLHDGARLWRAARAHQQQRRTARRMDLGLAFLEVEPGPGPANYHAAVTELGPLSREVELTLDLWADGDGGAASRPVGHVVLCAATAPRRRVPVRIRTDFAGTAEARWDGYSVPCHLQPAVRAGGGPGTLFLVLRHQGQEIDRIEMRLPGAAA